MEANNSSSWIGALFGSAVGLIVMVGLYVFYCYCLKLICEKAGHHPGALIWIPIAQFIPLLTVAKLPLWFIILLLIPPISVIVGVVMFVKICQARGKSGWLVILMFIPPISLVFIPYLAFSE
jgi:uncharacterized membrane protein YhaH (DUF805 family)